MREDTLLGQHNLFISMKKTWKNSGKVELPLNFFICCMYMLFVRIPTKVKESKISNHINTWLTVCV